MCQVLILDILFSEFKSANTSRKEELKLNTKNHQKSKFFKIDFLLKHFINRGLFAKSDRLGKGEFKLSCPVERAPVERGRVAQLGISGAGL